MKYVKLYTADNSKYVHMISLANLGERKRARFKAWAVDNIQDCITTVEAIYFQTEEQVSVFLLNCAECE